MPKARQKTIHELSPWNRFHVRISAAYSLAVLAVLAILSGVFYRVGLESELDGLRNRLLATAITLAVTLDADQISQIDSPEDTSLPEYQRVMEQFESICSRYPGITSMYVLLSTDTPNQLRFAVDYTPRDSQDQTTPGDPYDASSLPVMIQGLAEPAVEQEPFRDEWGLSLSGYAPLVTSDGRHVGLVGLDVDATRVDQIKRRVGLFSGTVFGLAAILLAVLGLFVGRSLRRPLATVMGASNEVARGNLKARVDVERKDEFGLLGENFNYMAHGLEERDFIRDTFGRYVSREVVSTLLDTPGAIELGGEEREVTVLLSDIERYSTIAEQLSPTQVVEMINAYLSAMNDIIDHHRGCVIEYLGDAILAVFGAPNKLPDHPAAAIRCAVEMRQRLAELNREWDSTGLSQLWKQKGIPILRTRIGIHTGTVVAGNLGSPSRMKYAVTGDTVNIAARLEALNKDLKTEILVSSTTWDQLSDDLKSQAVDRGDHQVKGRGQAIHVFSI
ncbi:MAG: HAMP domain-containing protein [Bradymonadales bacterium]|nr:HAMP domain-containing protein [Bradymonadales bacterium]